MSQKQNKTDINQSISFISGSEAHRKKKGKTYTHSSNTERQTEVSYVQ